MCIRDRLDLSSKTATYATHAADPMYYPLYVSNHWVDPLDKYLNDATLTDKAWFNYDDILKAWRDADSIDGKPYGIPYDGEVTVQVYRKDLYLSLIHISEPTRLLSISYAVFCLKKKKKKK